jgi:hypothetical protein
MGTVAEEGSRALDATSDLKDLLRLAHEAVHRIAQDVHGTTYESADALSRRLHEVRREADALSAEVNTYVRDNNA